MAVGETKKTWDQELFWRQFVRQALGGTATPTEKVNRREGSPRWMEACLRSGEVGQGQPLVDIFSVASDHPNAAETKSADLCMKWIIVVSSEFSEILQIYRVCKGGILLREAIS